MEALYIADLTLALVGCAEVLARSTYNKADSV